MDALGGVFSSGNRMVNGTSSPWLGIRLSIRERYPGRCFAGRGLLSYRPSGTSDWLAALANGPNVQMSCRQQTLLTLRLTLSRLDKHVAKNASRLIQPLPY